MHASARIVPSIVGHKLICSLIYQLPFTISLLSRTRLPDLFLLCFSGFTSKWLHNVSTHTEMLLFLKHISLCPISVLLYVLVLLPALSS